MPIILGNKHKCPDCGEIAFGRLQIGQAWGGQDYLELACGKCGTSYKCDLPKLEKKILYLDQFAISLMMRAQETGKNNKWSELFDRLKSMIQMQRIICPSSSEHRQESEFSKDRYDSLMDTCREMAMGHRLEGSLAIQHKQIYNALKAFMKDKVASWNFESKDAFESDPNAWHDDFAIDVDFGRQPEQIAERRKNKEAIQKTMEALYADPDYINRSFEEHVHLETEGFAHGLLGTFGNEKRELFEVLSGVRPPTPLTFLSSPSAQVVHMVLEILQRESQVNDRNNKAREFFFSPQFASVPAVNINAILRAVMGLKTKDSGRKPKPSDQYDLDIISSYMPYCDAMLIDGEMRSLATDGKAQLHQVYGTHLFSAKTLDKLIRWLDEVEASFPTQLRMAVSNVYEKERFDKLKLYKGRNLLEARKALFSMRPNSPS